MTTANEHMAADMAWMFSQDGEGVVDIAIDGQPHRAIVQELDIVQGLMDGVVVRRRALWLEKGKLTRPSPGYSMDIDEELWTVESIDTTGVLDVLTINLTA